MKDFFHLISHLRVSRGGRLFLPPAKRREPSRLSGRNERCCRPLSKRSHRPSALITLHRTVRNSPAITSRG